MIETMKKIASSTILGMTLFATAGATIAAEQQAAPAARGANYKPHHGGGMFGYINEAVHKDLKLSAEQEKTWQELSQKTRDYSSKTHQDHWTDMQAVRDEFKKENPDLNALSKKHDELQDSHVKAYRDMRDQWLRFYNNLSTEQKQKVNAHMKKYFERMDQRGRGGKGGMPMAPAASPAQQ